MINKLVRSKKEKVGKFHIGVSLKHITITGAALIFFILQSANTWAQGDTVRTPSMPAVDMAGTMRSNGKIYVVVTVLVMILCGLFLYLTRLDRKISRLEKGNWKE